MEEIQPLGYTEAKNVEEHKRIIDKINEMLVPVNSIEDDVGTVLTSLTAYMNDTIVPAIAQITDALASVQQSVTAVQQAVATVTGYNARLTDVEQYSESIGDDVAALDTEIHTTRPYVTTNTEQTITAKKHIPTATANDSSDVWVNKAFVQATDGRNNLVHNIGDEDKSGKLTLINNNSDAVLGVKRNNVTYPTNVDRGMSGIHWIDGNNSQVGYLNLVIKSNGTTALYIQLKNSDGSLKNVLLASGDVL